MVKVVLLLALGVTLASCNRLAEVIKKRESEILQRCEVGGILYGPWERTPDRDPCNFCRCNGYTGLQDCHGIMCGIPYCGPGVRPVSRPDFCCPVCPNTLPGGGYPGGGGAFPPGPPAGPSGFPDRK